MSSLRQRPVRSTEENPYRAMTREEVKAVAQLREEEGAFDTGSIIWLLAGGFVVQYFDVITALQYDPNIDRPYLAAGGVCLAIAGLIAMYCILILATIMKIPDYERHSPWAVPASTIFGALGLVLVILGVWPMWGVMTLFIVPVLFMSFVLGLALLGHIINF